MLILNNEETSWPYSNSLGHMQTLCYSGYTDFVQGFNENVCTWMGKRNKHWSKMSLLHNQTTKGMDT